MTNYILEKYKPLTYDNVILTEKKVLSDFLSEFEINKKKLKTKKNINSCISIIGDVGCGKNVLVNLTIQKHKYEAVYLNNNIINEYNAQNIFSYAFKQTKSPVIVIDKIELINDVNKTMQTMQKLNSQKMYCPIIFIMDLNHNKLNTLINKKCQTLTIRYNYYEILKLLDKILVGEKININEDNKLKILDHVKSDIRSLFILLNELYLMYKSIENKTNINDLIDDFLVYNEQTKEGNNLLFDITRELITNYVNPMHCIELYNIDKSTVNLMIQENYYNCIANQKTKLTPKKILNNLSNISNTIVQGDIIEDYIYYSQNWGLCNIHGFYSCVIPSKLLSDYCIPNKVRLNYPRDLSSSSNKSLNKKKMNEMMELFDNLSLKDLEYLNEICVSLTNDKKYYEIASFLDYYFNKYKLTLVNETKSKKKSKVNENINNYEIDILKTIIKINKQVKKNNNEENEKIIPAKYDIFPKNEEKFILSEFKRYQDDKLNL